MAALAHASDDDPAGMPASTLTERANLLVQTGGQIHKRIGFRAQHAPPHCDVTIGGHVDLRFGTERPIGIDRMVQAGELQSRGKELSN